MIKDCVNLQLDDDASDALEDMMNDMEYDFGQSPGVQDMTPSQLTSWIVRRFRSIYFDTDKAYL